jgi:hypothetical protein
MALADRLSRLTPRKLVPNDIDGIFATSVVRSNAALNSSRRFILCKPA